MSKASTISRRPAPFACPSGSVRPRDDVQDLVAAVNDRDSAKLIVRHKIDGIRKVISFKAYYRMARQDAPDLR
jgi:hypothetical protein